MSSPKIFTLCFTNNTGLRLLPNPSFISYLIIGKNGEKSLIENDIDVLIKMLKSFGTNLTEGEVKNFKNYANGKHKTSITTLKSQIIPTFKKFYTKLTELTKSKVFEEMETNISLEEMSRVYHQSKLELLVERYSSALKGYHCSLKNNQIERNYVSFQLQKYIEIYQELAYIKDTEKIKKHCLENNLFRFFETENPLNLSYSRYKKIEELESSTTFESIEELGVFTLDDVLYIISCFVVQDKQTEEVGKFMLDFFDSLIKDLENGEIKKTPFAYYTNSRKNICHDWSFNQMAQDYDIEEKNFDNYRSGKRKPQKSIINHISYDIIVFIVNLFSNTVFVNNGKELVVKKLKEFEKISNIAKINYEKYKSETN